MDTQEREKLIPLSQVPLLSWLPDRPDGTKVHLATLYRWASAGRRGHKLETRRTHAGLCTTEGWLAEFFENLATGGARSSVTENSRTPAVRRREFERAERELDKAGIGSMPDTIGKAA